jgi:hypothetical protein
MLEMIVIQNKNEACIKKSQDQNNNVASPISLKAKKRFAMVHHSTSKDVDETIWLKSGIFFFIENLY